MNTLKARLLTAAALAASLILDAAPLAAQEFIGYVKNTINPEDMALIPNTKWVIASTDKTPGKNKPGYLYIINAQTGVANLVKARVSRKPSAGDPSCSPIKLSNLAISGLGMRNRPDGSHQLLAVNRGQRMSIEFFDVDLSAASPAFTWTGCLVMPTKTFPNAVVATGKAGLAVTVSFETDNTELIPQLSKGVATGYLLEWTKTGGFYRVPGSEASLDNGLKIDPDGKYYYIADWGGEALLRVPVSGVKGSPLRVGIGAKPDNLSWSRSGTLIVAGQLQSAADIFACVTTSVDICPVPFKIIEVDPKTLSTIRMLVDGRRMDSYAAATTGLQVGGEIWASSFRNNKIARYRMVNRLSGAN